MRSKYIVIGIAVGVVLSSVVVVLAGSLDSPAAPGATSSYTLENIWNRLNAGTAGAQSTFTEPAAGPGTETMHTLNEIMAKAPAADNTNGATAANVLNGATFWGLNVTAAQWGPQTGAMPNKGALNYTPGTSAQAIAAGYHNGSGQVAGDADLVSANIKCGVTIFGVAGTILPACVNKTGQTSCWDASGNPISCTGTGQDGAYQKGCLPVVAPPPSASSNKFGGYNRTSFGCAGGFTDNGDGTVTDDLTGLVWLKNTDCWGTQLWANALTAVNNLASGSCGLTDGSVAGDWRLPNINELRSLFDPNLSPPYLPPGHPFTNLSSIRFYWSSTTYASDTDTAWVVTLYATYASYGVKGSSQNVWAVRDGP